MKILVIGRGSMGTRHLKNLTRLGQHEVCTFSSRAQPEKDKEFSSRFKATHLTTTREVEAFGPEALIIASPTHLHLEQIRWAKTLGAHVMVEKPVGDHFKDALSLSKQWPENLVFFQANVMRFHDVVAVLENHLKEKTLGTLLRAHLHYGAHLADWHPDEDYHQSYAARADMGGGCALTLMHELDLALHLFGPVVDVRCHSLNTGSLGIEVEDMVQYSMTHETIPMVQVHANMVERPSRRHLEIVGSQGRLTYDYADDHLLWHLPDGSVEDLPIPGSPSGKDAIEKAYFSELLHFLDAVEKGHPVKVGWNEALESLKICLQARMPSS